MADEINSLQEDYNLPQVVDRSQQAETLIRGLQLTNPKLYEALMMMFDQMRDTTLAISPIVITLQAKTLPAQLLLPPLNLRYLLNDMSIRLLWDRPTITGLFIYEVRFGNVDWNSASFVMRTQSTIVDVVPFFGLTGTYRLKTVNETGNYSETEITTEVLISAPGAVVITAQVIDNNILLQWTPPVVGSFAIDYYEISRDGVLQGTIKGTFTSYFEVVSGSYVYAIIPIDIAGNRGLSAEVTLQVNQPPDYVLQDEHKSTFPGTKVNALLYGTSLLVNVPTQTWQVHFVSRTWLDPQDQVSAGYPIYIQPAVLTGSYEEVIDFGSLLANVIITVRYNFEMITQEGTMLTIVRMATSTDGISYTPFVDGPSQFTPSMRYLKLRLEFTASVDTVLMRVFNLITTIAVKRENDGGEEMADKSHVGGTTVLFNKAFKDIESITATVKTPQEPFITVVDFVDVANPTGFKVFVFDSTGNRETKRIEWKARGVV